VLLTRFLDTEGVAEVSDFMPVEDAGRAHNLVRRAKTVRGEVRFRMRCDPRFDYARATHRAERRSETEVLFVGRSGDSELALRLLSSVPMRRRTGPPWPSSRCAPTSRPGSCWRWCSLANPLPSRIRTIPSRPSRTR
jgi:hypothetical protein